MKLSIVIVNYNVQHYLQLCLDSVFDALKNLNSEVIVVDNASVDESLLMIRSHFPAVKIIANSTNLGFSKANNIGVQAARGEYICILNPDTVVGEYVFENVYAFAKAQQKIKIGIIGVQLRDGTGQFLPESKRNFPTPKVSLHKILGDDASYYASHLTPKESGEVAVLVGAFMFLKKAVYVKVGGFDERYFMYGEDIDLSYSVKQHGFKNYYLGEEAVIHFKGESTIKDKVYRERFFGAMTLFYTKYFNRNSVEQFFVKAGIRAASLKSMLSGKLYNDKKKQSVVKSGFYNLVSDQDAVHLNLQQVLLKPVKMMKLLKDLSYGQEVIFDASYLSYSDIIKEIITHRDSGLTFKIIPKNCTFAIGSNSSDGRGEVIHFEKEN